jgi:hypothetical protein
MDRRAFFIFIAMAEVAADIVLRRPTGGKF